VRLWDPHRREMTAPMRHEGGVGAPAFSRDEAAS
jgi:hypothetical protein